MQDLKTLRAMAAVTTTTTITCITLTNSCVWVGVHSRAACAGVRAGVRAGGEARGTRTFLRSGREAGASSVRVPWAGARRAGVRVGLGTVR